MHRAISGTWHVDAVGSSPMAKARPFHSASIKQPARPNFLETELDTVCRSAARGSDSTPRPLSTISKLVYPISRVCAYVCVCVRGGG
jgi:hypothetical protein